MGCVLICDSDDSRVKWWYTLGKLSGYPNCCIDAFCLRKPTSSGAFSRRAFSNTGYVPCEKCSYHPKEFLLNYISSHRDGRLNPFPDDNGLTELAEYVFKESECSNNI